MNCRSKPRVAVARPRHWESLEVELAKTIEGLGIDSELATAPYILARLCTDALVSYHRSQINNRAWVADNATDCEMCEGSGFSSFTKNGQAAPCEMCGGTGKVTE